MPTELIAFASRYLWMLRIMRIWKFLAPRGFRPAWLFSLGRWINPYQVHRKKILESLLLAYPDIQLETFWHRWLNSHVHFVLDFLDYPLLDSDWEQRTVTIENPESLENLRRTGGLLLTYHTHHQNTLGCILGIKGLRISGIVSPPEDSPLLLSFPALGRWAKRINADSARHFSGGAYLFTNNIRKLVIQTKKELTNNNIVACLCDINTGGAADAHLLDRTITPPTGAIEVAIKLGAPIYLAFFAPEGEKLRLSLKKLDSPNDVTAVTTEYFAYLESFLRIAPWSWQGWEWYGSLPPTAGTPS